MLWINADKILKVKRKLFPLELFTIFKLRRKKTSIAIQAILKLFVVCVKYKKLDIIKGDRWWMVSLLSNLSVNCVWPDDYFAL